MLCLLSFTIKYQKLTVQQFFIDTPEQLNEFCGLIQDSKWLAIDTEFLREKTYYPVFCLLQVSNGKVAACIDPLALDDLSPITDILYRKDIIKVLHAAHQDLEIFYNLWQKIPYPVFDTQLAAAITGYGDQMGYGRLVEQVLNIQLQKDQARTDWSKRPLDADQQKYALNDVIYLADVYLQLEDKLKQLGRQDWLEAEYETFNSPATFKVAPEDAWSKVKGRQALKGVQFAILQKLAGWREQRAVKINRPRRWILKDEVLIDLARRAPANINQLKRIRGIEEKQLNNTGQQLLELIQLGRNLPKEQWPEDNRSWIKLSRQQEALVDLLMCCLRLTADRHDITAAAIAGKKDLEKLATGSCDTPLMQGWRRRIAGETLLDVVEKRQLPCWQQDGSLRLCALEPGE